MVLNNGDAIILHVRLFQDEFCRFSSFIVKTHYNTIQVFKTLTEYIQGPCLGNQGSLARSRLWDAVSNDGYNNVLFVLG